MNFDLADHAEKFKMLGGGLIAFVVLVGGLLLVLDVIPTMMTERKTARLAAAAEAGLPIERGAGRSQEGWLAFGFLLPAALLLAIGLIFPAIRTALLSFKSGNGNAWVGLDNYTWMFAQPDIRQVLFNTLIWVLVVPTLATAIGLIYAIMVDKARGEALAKALIFLPMAISFVGASIIWKFVYAYRSGDQKQIGLLNQVIVWLGGEPQQWLLEQGYKLNTLLLIVILIWIQAGFAMVILSAAIKAIPTEIVEAARIDGTNAWQMFWRVTLPAIRPAVIVVVITITIGTLKVFDIVRTMTNGNYETSVIANEMYNQSFRYGETGHGSALAVFLFVLVIPIVIFQIRNIRKQRSEA